MKWATGKAADGWAGFGKAKEGSWQVSTGVVNLTRFLPGRPTAHLSECHASLVSSSKYIKAENAWWIAWTLRNLR